MRKLLWVGDAVVDSGFARVTHGVLNVLSRYWDVSVVGVNYRGDPHTYPYDIYPAWVGGDPYGFNRTEKVAATLKPDFVVILTDPWHIPLYAKPLNKMDIPAVGSIAVDGKNCRGQCLNHLEFTIFWTKFGQREARKGGFQGKSDVIPLGVNTQRYRPEDKTASRKALGITGEMLNAFIIGNVNRNQTRKRLDLSIQYFAEWIKSRKINDAFFFCHVAPTGDDGYDLSQLAEYYGVDNRFILAEPNVWAGVPEERMVATYNSFDVQISTSQGEGWGLTTLEGMACGVPQIVPLWSALGEWTTGAAIAVPCPTQSTTPAFLNAVGGVPDKASFLLALDEVYKDKTLRDKLSQNGIALANRPEFSWENIGYRYAEEFARLYGTERKVDGDNRSDFFSDQRSQGDVAEADKVSGAISN
jgi:D-inositol-3-phosphate glycosyltransferase